MKLFQVLCTTLLSIHTIALHKIVSDIENTGEERGEIRSVLFQPDSSVTERNNDTGIIVRELPNKRTTLQNHQKRFWEYSAKTLKELKVPAPIILLGFPKAGTTSIDHYFRCQGMHVSHEECYSNPYKQGKMQNCGQMMMKNLENGEPMFQNTGDYHVYTGLFYSSTCIFPQITHLEQIHKSHPNATFLLHMRDLDKWVESTRRWSKLMNYGTMYSQIVDCFVENPHDRENRTIADLAIKNAYQKVIDGARKLVQEHPSHRLIEVHIDRDDAADIMESSFFHSPKSNCWNQENSNKRGKIGSN